jgi:three-Cys-motif partner protein
MQSSWKTSATYIEGFAGPGVYQEGEPGSPVVAVEVFLRRREFLDDGKKLTMVLVEEQAQRLESLKVEMSKAIARFGPKPSTLRLHYERGDCDGIVRPVLSRPRPDRGPVFAFLDSFGGPDVPFDLTRTIARLPSSEVLVTFGTSFFTRFGQVDAHQASGDQAFGGTAWRKVRDLPAKEKKPFLVSIYRQSLKAAGFSYVISFEMLDERSNDLHLIFGTSSHKGLEKMKDAMWKVDPVRGVHFRDPLDPAQMTIDFEPHPHLEPLQRAILAELALGDRTVGRLKEHALLETVYRPPHVRPALADLLSQQLVTRAPERGQLRDATMIRITTLGRQHSGQGIHARR